VGQRRQGQQQSLNTRRNDSSEVGDEFNIVDVLIEKAGEKDEIIKHKDEIIKHKDLIIEHKDGIIERKDEENAELKADNQQKDQTITALMAVLGNQQQPATNNAALGSQVATATTTQPLTLAGTAHPLTPLGNVEQMREIYEGTRPINNSNNQA